MTSQRTAAQPPSQPMCQGPNAFVVHVKEVPESRHPVELTVCVGREEHRQEPRDDDDRHLCAGL